jgi:UDP-N-acetylmuramoylalanine--D-glutamate ligase
VAATILNVTEDHMDRYPLGLQQYRAAKLRVYENAKVCVVNADDALTMPVRGADDRCISFGITGDYHLNRQQGETWLRVKGEKVLNVKEMKLTVSITTATRWRRWRWRMPRVCRAPAA